MIQISIPGMSKRFFPSPKCPEWLWGLPTLLLAGYWWFFTRSKAAGV